MAEASDPHLLVDSCGAKQSVREPGLAQQLDLRRIELLATEIRRVVLMGIDEDRVVALASEHGRGRLARETAPTMAISVLSIVGLSGFGARFQPKSLRLPRCSRLSTAAFLSLKDLRKACGMPEKASGCASVAGIVRKVLGRQRRLTPIKINHGEHAELKDVRSSAADACERRRCSIHAREISRGCVAGDLAEFAPDPRKLRRYLLQAISTLK